MKVPGRAGMADAAAAKKHEQRKSNAFFIIVAGVFFSLFSG